MTPRPGFRWGRLAAVLLGAIVVCYLAYLGGANWFLGSTFAGRVINRKPDRLRLEWSGARTWWPGSVVLDDVTIDGADRQFEWHARLDHVRVDLSLWSLPRRVFRTRQIVGRGLVFSGRRREGPASGGNAAAAASDFERPSPVPAPRRRVRDPWLLDLEGIQIADLREIAIENLTLDGNGEIGGGLELEVGGHLELDTFRLSFTDARFLRVGEPLGEDVSFTVAMSSPPFKPGEDSLREILSVVSAEVAMTADVASIASLGFLVRQPDWLSFAGSGHLDTAFRLREGVVEPGGHLDFTTPTLSARILDWRAEGAGTIALRMPEAGPPAALLDVVFERFAIRRGERAAAHVHGENLRVAVTAGALDVEHGLDDLHLRVDVPPSKVDLVVYNDYLPPTSFRIERGQGTLASWFEYSVAEKRGRGEVSIDVDGASGVAGELRVEGDLKLRTRVRGGDFDARRFDVSGSTLDLENVRVTRPDGKVASEGWWASFSAGTARLEMKEPLDAEVEVEGRLRDADPFLTALASRKKVLFWLDNLVEVRDLSGRALLDLGRERLLVRDVEIKGDRLEIEGDLGFLRGRREGLVYLKYGPFSTALEMTTDGERNWKLYRPRRWFEERRRAWRAQIRRPVPAQ